MSRENVELVRSVFEGWARGDFSAGSDTVAPDFEWRQVQTAVEPGVHAGPAVSDAMRRIFEVYEDLAVVAEEFIDAGDRVVVVARTRGVARGSQMQLDQGFAFLWTLRDGSILSNELYADRDAALKAAGLGN